MAESTLNRQTDSSSDSSATSNSRTPNPSLAASHSGEGGNSETFPVAENLITEHLDIWTSAIKQKSRAGRGSSKKHSLHGIKKLRDLILELAVRGKLVPQDVSDEPASVLLERIAAEKAQSVKDKKIKKPKSLPEISEDEKPFELPRGWEWVFFGTICEIERGGSPRPIKSFITEEANGLNWIKIGDTDIGGKYITKTAEKIRPEGLKKTRQVFPGDFLLTNSMSFGRPYITQIEGCIHDGWLRISPPVSLDKDYLYSLLSSPFIVRSFKKSAAGAVVMNLNADKVKETLIAVPPTEEQHRIVAKVDELMILCDALEAQTEASITAHQTLVETLLNALLLPTNSTNTAKPADSLKPTLDKESRPERIESPELSFEQNWQRVAEHFDTLFTTNASIDILKQTILQLAVMGKLAPQNESEEPAAKLLERIAAEKAQLIADKKIKNQKPLPAITDEEKPFELPKGWDWCRIAEASLFTEYGTSEKAIEGANGVPVLKMGDIQQGKVLHGGQKVVPIAIADLPNLYLNYGDVLYNRTNSAELVGKTGMFEGEKDTYTFASYLIRIRCHFESVIPQFLTLAMNSPLFRTTQIDPHVKQQCGQANVNGTIMKSMLVPICPLEEQHRIVAKVDEIMALCDQLKARLTDAQITQRHLTDAIVEQAIN